MNDHAKPLLESDLDPDPLRQFERWFVEAGNVSRAPEATAVATATASGVPSVRMVLLKRFDETGFVFDSPAELHDTLAQSLAAIAVNLARLEKLSPNQSPVR